LLRGTQLGEPGGHAGRGASLVPAHSRDALPWDDGRTAAPGIPGARAGRVAAAAAPALGTSDLDVRRRTQRLPCARRACLVLGTLPLCRPAPRRAPGRAAGGHL